MSSTLSSITFLSRHSTDGACFTYLEADTNKPERREVQRALHNSILLQYLGDLGSPCFQTWKDIVIPPLVTNPKVCWSKHFPLVSFHNVRTHHTLAWLLFDFTTLVRITLLRDSQMLIVVSVAYTHAYAQ
jgi:hypothetical protein